MVSAILVITSVFLGVFSGVLCLRLKELLPSKSKAPRVYLFILVLTLVLQFVTYVLIVTNFLLLLFFPKHKRITFLSIVNGSIIQLIPILLLICTLIALQARLLALKESRPLASRTRFRIANYGNNILCLLLVLSWVLVSIQDRAVPDALNGNHTQHTEPPGDGGRERSDQKNTLDLGRLGQLAYAVIFACLTYSIMIHARKVNVYLLLPDQVSYFLPLTPFSPFLPELSHFRYLSCQMLKRVLGSVGYKHSHRSPLFVSIELFTDRRCPSTPRQGSEDPIVFSLRRNFYRWGHLRSCIAYAPWVSKSSRELDGARGGTFGTSNRFESGTTTASPRRRHREWS